MKKGLPILLLAGLIIGAGSVFIMRHQPAYSVHIVVPDQYSGRLTIKQDAARGRQADEKALENFNSYIYEFTTINKRIVFVDDISHLLDASEIKASEMSIAPLESQVIEKNNERREVILEIRQ